MGTIAHSRAGHIVQALNSGPVRCRAQVRSAMFYTRTANITASGTSMACPVVSGVSALYLQANPAAVPAEACALLLPASPSPTLQSRLCCTLLHHLLEELGLHCLRGSAPALVAGTPALHTTAGSQ